MRYAGNNDTGMLRLGVTPALATVAAPMMWTFCANHPCVGLELIEEASAIQLDKLVSAEVDAAFIIDPLKKVGILCQPICSEEMQLAVPIDHEHVFKRDGEIRLKTFANDAFAIPSRRVNCAIHDEVIRGRSIAGFLPKFIEYEPEQSYVGRVSAGLGILSVNRKSSSAPPTNITIAAIESVQVLEVDVAWRSDDPPPIITDFVTFASTRNYNEAQHLTQVS